MKLEFDPPISNLPRPEFRPAMIECAYDYCMTCLCTTHKRGAIQSALAALAIEIVLKSFSARPSDKIGTVDERYQFVRSGAAVKSKGRGHGLVDLANSIPAHYREYLFSGEDFITLEESDSDFSVERYYYEESARGYHSDSSMRLAISIICKIVFLYKAHGCNDLFISLFNVDNVYFKYCHGGFLN